MSDWEKVTCLEALRRQGVEAYLRPGAVVELRTAVGAVPEGAMRLVEAHYGCVVQELLEREGWPEPVSEAVQ